MARLKIYSRDCEKTRNYIANIKFETASKTGKHRAQFVTRAVGLRGFDRFKGMKRF